LTEERAAGLARVRERLRAPVDAAGLGVFRIGFGLISAWEIWRTFDGNLIQADYATPQFLFRWWALEWVRPMPGRWLSTAFVVTGIAALFLAAGLFYRFAAVVHFLGISYWFALDKATYLNHRYLTALFAFLLIFLPADAAFSVDARRKPWIRSRTVPAWSIWLLRLQAGVPYMFSGVAKMNFDWLVRGEPLRTWLRAQTDFPFVGQFFTSGGFVHGLAIASTAFDTLIVLLLLYRRTRPVAFVVALGFHFLNSRLFEIGMFPWLMIVATTVFLDPDWPRRMWRALRARRGLVVACVSIGFVAGFVVGGFLPRTFSAVMALTGGVGTAVGVFHLLPARMRETVPAAADHDTTPWRGYGLAGRVAVVLTLFAVLQVLLPLRQFVIPGNVAWTTEGQRFAWQLLVRQSSGAAVFKIDGPGAESVGAFNIRAHITSFQTSKMIWNPDMLVQFAHYIEEYFRDIGVTDDIEVRVDTNVSLNGRRPQDLIDPDLDLTRIRRPWLPPAPWIEPLRPFDE
jgi:hypothetical protein